MHTARARIPRIGALSVAAVTASLAMSAALASTAAADGPGDGTPTVVTIGDSAAAGEGGRWAGNTNGEETWRTDALGAGAYGEPGPFEAIPGCHRSKVATAPSALGGGVQSKNLACSGAKTTTPARTGANEDFKPGVDFYEDDAGRIGQALELQRYSATHNVKAVVVTIGGNDYGFGDIVLHCLRNFMTSPSWAKNLCKDDREMTARFTPAAKQRVTDSVTTALGNVKTAMERAGYSQAQYSIIVRTYWSPIPRGGQFRYGQGFDRQTIGGCGIYDADATWANDVVISSLNTTLKNAAAQSGLPNIKILNQQQMLLGRRLCENTVGLLENTGLESWRSAGAEDQTEWVAQIRTLSTLQEHSPYMVQESLHASYWGQMAMRNCLRQAYNGGSVRGGNCLRVANGVNAGGEPNMELRQPAPPPLNVSLSCEPVGSYRIACSEQATGGSAPYAIKWYIDGAYYGGLDNEVNIVHACNRNKPTNAVQVEVTDARGARGDRSTTVACVGDAP